MHVRNWLGKELTDFASRKKQSGLEEPSVKIRERKDLVEVNFECYRDDQFRVLEVLEGIQPP
jgi:hypothetical protein